jgi:GT2 family glycosyltransferase
MTFASNETVMMTEAGTTYLLEGGDLETAMGDGTRHPNTFSGVVAVSREAWETIGGFDERYGSWGGEDQSAWAACWALTGYERIEGVQAHLWHPTDRSQREDSPTYPANDELMRRYLMAKRDPVAMRALLSEPGGPLFDADRITPA